MALFDEIRKVISAKRPASSSAIATALASAQDRRAELIRRRGDIESRRLDAVVAGDDVLAAHRAELTDAIEDERTAATIVDALQQRLVDAQRREAEADRRKRHEAAMAARDAAAVDIVAIYPQAAAAIAALLRRIAEADLAVEAANHDLPIGAAPLATTEHHARMTPGTALVVVAEDVVELWAPVGVDDPQPVTDAVAAQIERDPQPGRGFIRRHDIRTADARGPSSMFRPRGGGLVSVVAEFELRPFRRREILDGVAGEMPESLQVINLPPLMGGDAPFWTPAILNQVRSAAGVLAALDELDQRRLQPRPTSARVKRVTFEPLPRINLNEAAA